MLKSDPATDTSWFRFSEYEDIETAMTTMWNLKGHVLNGRSLKFSISPFNHQVRGFVVSNIWKSVLYMLSLCGAVLLIKPES